MSGILRLRLRQVEAEGAGRVLLPHVVHCGEGEQRAAATAPAQTAASNAHALLSKNAGRPGFPGGFSQQRRALNTL